MIGRIACLLGLVLATGQVWACGPTPQKVSKEVLIHAEPNQVWAVVRDISQVSQWHPLVRDVSTRQETGEEGPVDYATLFLEDNGTLIERVRPVSDEDMIVDTWMEQTTLPVSNYRGVLTVKPGAGTHETIVVWSGRFNNKANILDAPAGEDNATAIAAISRFYEYGLSGLRQRMEYPLSSR